MLRTLIERIHSPARQRRAAIILALTFAAAIHGFAQPAGATPGDPRGPHDLRECVAAAAQGTGEASTFLVVYSPGPAWRAGRPVSEQPMPGHLPFVRHLYDAGLMMSAGPFLDDTGGAMVIRARSLEAAEQIVACDPAVREGVMVGTLKQWRMIDWERDAATRRAGRTDSRRRQLPRRALRAGYRCMGPAAGRGHGAMRRITRRS